MQIVYKKPDELIPYENNPRINDEAVKYVANSIRDFGFKQPIVIDKENVIVCGHTRIKASKLLKLDEVPCVVADDLTEEEIAGLRLADNQTGSIAEWDFSLLDIELEKILDLDMARYGFGVDDELDEDLDGENPYTDKVMIPQYKITGECPDLTELADFGKADLLSEEIEAADIDEDVKDFLISAAQRHVVFDYSKIAEYYAHANKDVQALMERSALVIIDYEDAIANGYTDLFDFIEEHRRGEIGE